MHELQNDSVCLPSDVDDDDESCRSCHRSLGHTHTHPNTPSNTQLSCISHGRPVPAPPRCAHLLNSSFQVSFSDMLFVCCCPWLPSPKPSPCPFSRVCVCARVLSPSSSPLFFYGFTSLLCIHEMFLRPSVFLHSLGHLFARQSPGSLLIIFVKSCWKYRDSKNNWLALRSWLQDTGYMPEPKGEKL